MEYLLQVYLTAPGLIYMGFLLHEHVSQKHHVWSMVADRIVNTHSSKKIAKIACFNKAAMQLNLQAILMCFCKCAKASWERLSYCNLANFTTLR